MRFIDFFSGIGGFHLAFKAAGHECVGWCEVDEFARRSYTAMHLMPPDRRSRAWRKRAANERLLNEYESPIWTARDVRAVEPSDLPEADIYTFGFPCQSFSIAGKRGGFADTRGTLFFEVMRLAKARQPRLLVGENVAGLLSHDGGDTFETILEAMGELGYSVEWQVINSKYYLPQNRERVFIIGHSRTECTKKIFPITKSNGTADGVQGCKANTITAHTGGSNSIGTYIIESEQPTQGRGTGLKQIPGNLYGTNIEPNPAAGRVYDPSGIAPALLNPSGGGHRETKNAIPVLTPDRAEKRQNGRRFKNDGEPMFTLTAQDRHGVAVAGIYTGVSESHQRGALRDCSRAIKGEKHDAGVIIRQRGHGFNKGGIHKIAPTLSSHAYAENNLLDDGLRIRKLTPRECFRLQGFPDEYFDRAAAVNSDSQLYKQAGNSVTVPVVYEIAKAIKEAYEK